LTLRWEPAGDAIAAALRGVDVPTLVLAALG
jgi:hypothetical protein